MLQQKPHYRRKLDILCPNAILGQSYIISSNYSKISESFLNHSGNCSRPAFNRKTKKSFVRKSSRHLAWQESAIAQLKYQWGKREPIPKDRFLNAAIVSYMPTKRKVDADNLYGGPMDALQAACILEDDYCIRTHNGSDRCYDKEKPRVEITLTEYRGDK